MQGLKQELVWAGRGSADYIKFNIGIMEKKMETTIIYGNYDSILGVYIGVILG